MPSSTLLAAPVLEAAADVALEALEALVAVAATEESLEATLLAEETRDEAEDAALPVALVTDPVAVVLLAAAAAEEAQVAAVGRFVTPAPEQRASANSMVAIQGESAIQPRGEEARVSEMMKKRNVKTHSPGQQHHRRSKRSKSGWR